MVFKPQTFHELPPQAELDDPTDATLESDVAEALGRAGLVDATRVSVTAKGGTITLLGYVGSDLEVNTAAEAAGLVRGVENVENRLMVQAGKG